MVTMKTLYKTLVAISIVLSGEAFADSNPAAASDDPRVRLIADSILAERQVIVAAHDEFVLLTKQSQAARNTRDQILRKQKDPTHPALVRYENDRLALIKYEQETQSMINRQHQADQKAYDAYIEWLAEQRDKAARLREKEHQEREAYVNTRAEHDEQVQTTKDLINSYNQKIQEHNNATGSERVALAAWIGALEPTLEAHREQIRGLHQRALEQHKKLIGQHNKLTRQIQSIQELKQQKESALAQANDDRNTIVDQRRQEIKRIRDDLAASGNQIQTLMKKERNDANARVNALRKSIEDSFGSSAAEFDNAVVGWLNNETRDTLFQADGKTPRFNFTAHWVPKIYQALSRIEQRQMELQRLFEDIRSSDRN